MTTTIEVLYYRLYNAVLLAKIEEAKLYLSILREEYEKTPEEFDILKDDGRWVHLIQLGEQVDNNLVIKKYEVPNENIIANGDEHRTQYEKDLVNAICKDQSVLRKALGASGEFYLSNKEHPTRFGSVDLVGNDKKIRYVIEVKKGVAKHDVVSQIDKYMIDFKLKLILKIFDTVQGVVIANGFSDYALRELQKMNVILIKYSYNKKLTMRKL